MKLKKKSKIVVICLGMCLAVLGIVWILINPFPVLRDGSCDRALRLGVVMSGGNGRIVMQVKEGMEDAASKYGDDLDMLMPDMSYSSKEYDGIILDSGTLWEKVPDHMRTVVLDELTEDASHWEEAVEFVNSLKKSSVAYIVSKEEESIPFAELIGEDDYMVEYGKEEETVLGDADVFFCLSDQATEWIVSCKEKGLVAEEIPVVGVVSPEYAVLLLEKSMLDAAIVTDYYAMGYEAVRAMHSKESIRIRRRLITPDEMYKSENVSLLFPFLY